MFSHKFNFNIFFTQFRESEYGSQETLIKPVFLKENFIHCYVHIHRCMAAADSAVVRLKLNVQWD